MKQVTKVLVVMLILGSASWSAYEIASAFSTFGGKWGGFPLYYIRTINGGALNYPRLVNKAVRLWNVTPTKVDLIRITTDGYENIALDVAEFGWRATCDGVVVEFYGCTSLYPSLTANPYTYSYIRINRTVIEGDEKAGNEVKGIIAHEIGHALGLAHVPTDPPVCVLMYPSTIHRFEVCGISSPQQDDIDGINSLYP